MWRRVVPLAVTNFWQQRAVSDVSKHRRRLPICTELHLLQSVDKHSICVFRNIIFDFYFLHLLFFAFILYLFLPFHSEFSLFYLCFFYPSPLSILPFCLPFCSSVLYHYPLFHPTHMLLIEAHICIKGLSVSRPNTAAGNVRGVNFYKGWFIRETLVCSLKLILYQKFSLSLDTRLMKLRPALIKPVWVTIGVQSGICKSRVLLLYSCRESIEHETSPVLQWTWRYSTRQNIIHTDC
jgi:hypothetical protein